MQSKGLISWFTRNPVAANLAMLLIIAAGLISAMGISKEMFPRSDIDRIQINVPYPGAAPVEVEKGVILPIEAALKGLKGIKKINATASRDYASLSLEIEANEDINEVMAQVENRIDSIVNFPQDLEKPNVSRAENFGWVINVNVSGAMNERIRKELGQEIRDELLDLPDIKRAILWGTDDYEIAIEVKEDRLRELDLTLAEVAQVLRQSSIDLPAGMIRAENGNVLVRTQGKAYRGEDFASLVLRSHPDGTQLLVSDIADVKDGFAETNATVRFDGAKSISVGVFSLKDQDLISLSDSVKQYVEEKRSELPDGLKINYVFDGSYNLRGRLDMMLSNLAMGSVLVAIVLGLFLNLQVARWVMVGIPVSFLGAIWLMPINPYPVTVNVLSLFAFIMVLGIVVDDAIIIGESIFSEAKGEAKKAEEKAKQLNGGETPEDFSYVASVDTVVVGAKRVATPSTIGVLTTMAAFLPILFIGGNVAGFLEAISVVVILCLTFSLIESKLILPAHLVGLRFTKPKPSKWDFIKRWQKTIDQYMTQFVKQKYQPFLARCMQHRYVTLSSFIAVLIVASAALGSGIARFEFFPDVPGDNIRANIIMQDGVSSESLVEALKKVEAAAYKVDSDYRKANPETKGLVEHVLYYSESDVQGNFIISLVHAEERELSSVEFEKRWRKEVGNLPNVRKQNYYATTNTGGGAKINLSLYGEDPDQLSLAGAALQEKLGEYNGVFDIYNSQGIGAQEILISLKPYASQLGIKLGDVARQVRQAFYGEEVQRLQRGADTLKVMVRYPLEDRRSIATLEEMYIRTANGQAVAIGEVADIRLGLGLTSIKRTDRKRTITITADVDAAKIQSGTVISDITGNYIPQLLKQYPGVGFGLGGASEEQSELISRMFVGLIAALFLIYGLLAIPLRSYVQPLVIMSVIPFGFIGAVVGHIVFDMTMSMLSVFGLIALAGVVVNDSLILVEFANRARLNEKSDEDALMVAGARRFRAIFLTTTTTFVGLLPMLFETSMQAQFVIPMALSLSFGIVSATAITLILVPCLYLVVHDVREFKESVVASSKAASKTKSAAG
ncbi:MAG: efflux RND transporter permease subunit [Porticoccaceae bacterium]